KMTLQNYLKFAENIVNGIFTDAPYDRADMLNYAKLNISRMNRYFKTFEPSEEVATHIKNIQEYQKWIVITEPWCGDAAHIVPVLFKISELNPHIDFEINLRDSEESLIDNYLTNGGKSIPKLIIRNK